MEANSEGLEDHDRKQEKDKKKKKKITTLRLMT